MTGFLEVRRCCCCCCCCCYLPFAAATASDLDGGDSYSLMCQLHFLFCICFQEHPNCLQKPISSRALSFQQTSIVHAGFLRGSNRWLCQGSWQIASGLSPVLLACFWNMKTSWKRFSMHVWNARQATGTPAALGGCGINEQKDGQSPRRLAFGRAAACWIELFTLCRSFEAQ